MEDDDKGYYLFYKDLENSINDVGCEAISDNGNKCDITFQLKTFGLDKVDCRKYCINHIYNWFDHLYNTRLNFIISLIQPNKHSPISSAKYSYTQSVNNIVINENEIYLYCIIINYNSIENNKVNVPLLVFSDYTLIKTINTKKILDKIYKKDYYDFYNNLNKNYKITQLKLIYLTNYEKIFENVDNKTIDFYYNKKLINNIKVIKNNLFNDLPNEFLFTKKLL